MDEQIRKDAHVMDEQEFTGDYIYVRVTRTEGQPIFHDIYIDPERQILVARYKIDGNQVFVYADLAMTILVDSFRV